jgi:hypothetical protein
MGLAAAPLPPDEAAALLDELSADPFAAPPPAAPAGPVALPPLGLSL